MKDIVIVGAGGIGREVAYFIEEINLIKPTWNIIGLIDENVEMHGKSLNGIKVIGGLEHLNTLYNKPYVIVAIANCDVKRSIVERLKDEYNFATIIHPTIRINKYLEIGEGSVIYPGVILTVNTKIGNHVLISGNCGIGHDTTIGDYSSILWGSNFSGYDTVGECCFIGIGTSVIQSIDIKNNTKINQTIVLNKKLVKVEII